MNSGMRVGLLLGVLSIALTWPCEASAGPCFQRIWSLLERGDEISTSQKIENYRRTGRRQEAAYVLRKSGDSQTADLLEIDIERTLRRTRIIGEEKLKGNNASDPVLVTFEDGTQAIRKSGLKQAADVDSEVTAYEIDKIFGRAFGVPVTVGREVNGVRYSFQYFVKGIKETSSRSSNLKFFDYLIDNTDVSAPGTCFA